jgi:hypothetical protein
MQYSIDQLIVNSPYKEPTSHWAYRQTRFFTRKKGRRPAGYVTPTPGTKSFDDPGNFHLLTAPPNTAGPRRSNGRSAT